MGVGQQQAITPTAHCSCTNPPTSNTLSRYGPPTLYTPSPYQVGDIKGAEVRLEQAMETLKGAKRDHSANIKALRKEADAAAKKMAEYTIRECVRACVCV